tara:strand:- start:3328 stop:3912 length:585 start_codon:yes stop_codon:yes gene_type:complete
MITTRWWWVRHAPSAGSPGIIHGQDEVDADLSDQVAIDARRLSLPEDAVWLTSGLNRTVQTAAALGGKDCRAVPGLMEQNFGEWNGKAWDTMDKAEARAFWEDYTTQAPPGGESVVHLMDRVSDAVADLTLEYQGRDIIAVAHAGSIRSAVAVALNLFAKSALSVQIDTLSLTRIDCLYDEDDGPSWRVMGLNL